MVVSYKVYKEERRKGNASVVDYLKYVAFRMWMSTKIFFGRTLWKKETWKKIWYALSNKPYFDYQAMAWDLEDALISKIIPNVIDIYMNDESRMIGPIWQDDYKKIKDKKGDEFMKAYKKLSDDATGIMLNLYNECIEYDELNTIPTDDKTAKRLAVLRKDIFARLSVLIPNMWN